MKPMYQERKKIVPGTTNALRLLTSSWNSGDLSISSQSTSSPASRSVDASTTDSSPRVHSPRGSNTPLSPPFTLFLLRCAVLRAWERFRLRRGLRLDAAAALHLGPALLARLGLARPRRDFAGRPR